jgi:hypothetical protein
MIEQIYQVISITQRPSKLNGGFYWVAMLQNLKSQNLYETSIDPTMRNFEQWQPVVKNSHKGILLSGCKIVKRKNKAIVDADSPIHVEYVCDRDEMNRVVAEWRSDQDPWNNLFDKGDA